MRHRSPYRNGVPRASQFEDGRMGIICKAEGVEIDWRNTLATSSSDFITRCVVVRTRADRYYAVGEEAVVNLGLLDLETAPPAFSGSKDYEIANRRYITGIPQLVIGRTWEAAKDMAGDSSAVDFTHIDWRKDHRRFLSQSIVSFDMPNYFDSARQMLSVLEPIAPNTKAH